MGIAYSCLVVDHDDTAVDSTALVHHAAHVETMNLLRPHMKPLDVDGWHLMNFSFGISVYLEQELRFTE